MKSIVQDFRRGNLSIEEVPAPALRPGGLLVQNQVSLVSAGTERMMVEFAQKNLIHKAWGRPDLVRQVWDKICRDGLSSTLEVVRHRLDTPVNLGYSLAGTVMAVGEGVEGFHPGDRVACAGAGFANHAEVVFIPQNLAVKLPDSVDFESASFTTLGAIGLQGLRLAEVQLGGTMVVIGLGLIGLLTVQLAKAAGCQVAGMDPNPARAELAHQLGADAVSLDREGLLSVAGRLSSNQGADAVLITASNSGNEPVTLAGEVARDRGVVVAIGAVGMEIPRKKYYEKELTFRVSRSYGPGRYDSEYEENGKDYPIGYVRWTENRNMQAFAQLLADGKVKAQPLITHRFPITEAFQAYDLILGKRDEPSLGILLTYPSSSDLISSVASRRISYSLTEGSSVAGRSSAVRVGLLGAGQFATSTLLPAMKKVPGIEFMGICTAGGVSAGHVGKKFGFRFATTDEMEIIQNPEINTVVIATRHHLHARQVITALKAGKNVFVEKPLCLNENELNEIVQVYSALHPPHFGLHIPHSNGSELYEGERPLAPTNSERISPFQSASSSQPSAPSVASSEAVLESRQRVNSPQGRSPVTHGGTLLEAEGRSSSPPQAGAPLLMVGFNRRFALMARSLKDFLVRVKEPLVMHYRVNAGYISPDHWVHDPAQGGGRILGEVCHFVDFLTFLAGSLPQQVYSRALPNNRVYRDDNLSITIEFENGSLGTIAYVANGDRRFPKERIEVFGGGAVAVLDNFRRLELIQGGRRQVYRSWLRQDKGHRGGWEAFTKTIQAATAPPIPFEEIVYTSSAPFRILESMHLGEPVKVSRSSKSRSYEQCFSISL